MKKIALIIALILLIGAAAAGILWYYQSQGMIKIFPTFEELSLQKILTIDQSKFIAPQGTPPEKLARAIAKINELKDSLLKDPNNPQLWFEFGYMKNYLNDFSGAALAYKKSLELGPANPVPAINLGNIYLYFIKDNQQAEYYFLDAISHKKDSPLAFSGLLDLYRYNWQEKQSAYEPTALRAIQDDPENAAHYYFRLVDFFAATSTQNMVKAKSYVAVLKNLDPKSAETLQKTYLFLR